MESEQLNKSSEIEAAAPVIEPGHTFASVTDKISAIVLTQTDAAVLVCGFRALFHAGFGLAVCDRLPADHGCRRLGNQYPSRVGVRDCQFRLVDRYRPCGDT